MPVLHLAIENFDNLPDGGPVTMDVRGRRGIDIGRDPYLDWTLPDPDRFVSGKHCEIRFKDGAYWLVDMSSNGTFVNGAEGRLAEPYRLRSGDRIEIGPYIVAATVEDDLPGGADLQQGAAPAGDVFAGEPADANATAGAADEDIWGVSDDVPEPVSPRSLQPPSKPAGAVKADFLEWQMDLHDLADRDEDPPGEAAPLTEDLPSRRSEEAVELPPVPGVVGTGPRDDRSGYPRLARPAEPQPREAEPTASEPDPEPHATTASSSTRTPLAHPPAPQAGQAAPPSPTAERWDPEHAQSRIADAPFGDAPMIDDAARPHEAPPAPDPAVAPAQPTASPPAPSRDALEDFLETLAAQMGVPAASLQSEDPDEVARRIGLFMVQSVSGLQQLLRARSEARGAARARGQTVVHAVGNNPLKFLPNPDDVLKILFGPRTNSYLDIEESLGAGFRDLASHQVATYAAMQRALSTLLKDLEPEAIERKLGTDSGLSSIVSSRKGRLWDEYREVWETRSVLYGDSMLDTFMMYFGQFYQDHRDEDDTRP